MKKIIPYSVIIISAIYFVFLYGKDTSKTENIIENSNIDYCSIEKNKFYSILKGSNFFYNLDKNDFLKTSILGNSSISLVYLNGKEAAISKSLNNLGIKGEVTENGTKYNIDIKIDKKDTTEFLLVPCCLIVNSLP
jgi:hypothetical protein